MVAKRLLRGKLQLSLLVLLAILSMRAVCTAEPTPDQLLWKAALKGKGNVDLVKQALDQGANVNVQKGGWTILMRVVGEGHLEIAEILLAHTADPNMKGFRGETALTIAAEHGHTAIVKTLLAKGASVNAKTEHGDTALHYAAEFGHRDVVRVLLDAGADIKQIDQDGETALDIARRKQYSEIILVFDRARTTK